MTQQVNVDHVGYLVGDMEMTRHVPDLHTQSYCEVYTIAYFEDFGPRRFVNENLEAPRSPKFFDSYYSLTPMAIMFSNCRLSLYTFF